MNKAATIIASIVTIALITSLILPGRQTPGVINALGNNFAAILRAAIGTK